MPIAIYWGDDDFTLNRAIATLRDRVLDPAWADFNYDKIGPEVPDSLPQALSQAVTPPFGAGGRLVWLAETTLLQRCPEPWLKELERTLPQLPETTTLLLTGKSKPDGRLKATKFLQKHAEIREFSSIAPWKTDELVRQVQRAAKELKVAVTPAAAERLAAAAGNNTRQLYNELEKLALFVGAEAGVRAASPEENREAAPEKNRPIGPEDVAALVSVSTQSSLELAKAIAAGDRDRTLGLVADLIARNEPALRIVAVLVGQFRTWLWVKLMVEKGERSDRAIAEAAEVGNPKRVYFLKREVQPLSARALAAALPVLLVLEWDLKRGGDPLETLQLRALELCEVCTARSRSVSGGESRRAAVGESPGARDRR